MDPIGHRPKDGPWTPFDHLTRALHDTKADLDLARSWVEETARTGGNDPAEIGARLLALKTQLEGIEADVHAAFADQQQRLAMDRVENLLLHFRLETLPRPGYYELTHHTPHEVQEALGYPEGLVRQLRNPALLQAILANTKYTHVREGVFAT